MKKHSPSDKNNVAGGHKAGQPAGKRSGKGSSSVMPYLSEEAQSKPAPLEPHDDLQPPPAKRSRWRW
jgi:hypothetical protein